MVSGLLQKLGLVIVPSDTAVDVRVKGHKKSQGFLLPEHFYPCRGILMVEKGYGPSDKLHGGFIQPAAQAPHAARSAQSCPCLQAGTALHG